VEFGARCRLLKSIDPPPQDGYEPKPEEILATMESVYIAEYVIRDTSVEPAALQAFSQHNVAYHVWPYWREHLHDITSRALLPRITLPMHVFKAALDKKPDASEPSQPQSIADNPGGQSTG
jgi:hypothetical protein